MLCSLLLCVSQAHGGREGPLHPVPQLEAAVAAAVEVVKSADFVAVGTRKTLPAFFSSVACQPFRLSFFPQVPWPADVRDVFSLHCPNLFSSYCSWCDLGMCLSVGDASAVETRSVPRARSQAFPSASWKG